MQQLSNRESNLGLLAVARRRPDVSEHSDGGFFFDQAAACAVIHIRIRGKKPQMNADERE